MSGPTLITGAAGFAGSHLIERLLGRGTAGDLVAWSRPGGALRAGSARLRWEAVDMLNGPGVRAAVSRLRPAVVYHCAGAAHVGRSWNRTVPTLEINVLGTHHLIEALREARVEARVLIPSSAMIYRPSNGPLREDHPLVPHSPYGLSKLAQELLARQADVDGIRVGIARPFNHVGPRQDPSFVASSFARQIAEIEVGARPPELVVGNLDARRDVVDVRDTVRAYVLIVERGESGRPYNVCSGKALAIRELLDLLIARSRVAVRIRVDPDRYQRNDLPVLVGDPSRIRNELAWMPEIPLERTADDLLEYWRERVKTIAGLQISGLQD